jgi:hypothetical protein
MHDSRVTSILHGPRMTDEEQPRAKSPIRALSRSLPLAALFLSVVSLSVVSLGGCVSASDAEDPVGNLDPSVFDVAGADEQPKQRPKTEAVTQIGREILPQAGMVVRGHTTRVSRVRGTEVARFEVEEVLRSVPWDQLPDTMGTPETADRTL